MKIHLFPDGMPRKDVPHVYMLAKIVEQCGQKIGVGAYCIVFEGQVMALKLNELGACNTETQATHKLLKLFLEENRLFFIKNDSVTDKALEFSEMPFYVFLTNNTVVRHLNGLSCVGESFHQDFLQILKLKAGLKPTFRFAKSTNGWVGSLRDAIRKHLEKQNG